MLDLFITYENSKDPTITYLTGYSPSFALLATDGKNKCMFTIPFEKSLFKGVRCFDFSEKYLKKKLLSYFKLRSLGQIGINMKGISFRGMKSLKTLLPAHYVDVSRVYALRRMVKEKNEILAIKQACKITDKLFGEITHGTFKTEREVYNFIKHRCIDLHVDLAFDPIVATAKNGASPHYYASNIRLDGFTVIDMGVKVNGYCSDMTRTVYYGKPSEKEIIDYHKVLKVQTEALQMIKPGRKCSELDVFARKILGKEFVHSLGHGVGVEIHEMPSISSRSKEVLKRHMVITIEPGVYLKNKYGIRIEDTVLVEDKPLVLTQSRKDLIVLP